MTASRDVLAVVVAYNPEPSLAQLCQTLITECDVLVVDNASIRGLDIVRECGLAGAQVVRAETNTGVAGALATAHEQAIGRGWLLTFDQDSVVEAGFVATLLDSTAAHRADTAMIGPVVRDAATGEILQGHTDEPVRYLITSGALCRVSALDDITGFRRDLFIDHVDTDVCLRLRRAGWTLAIEPAAEIRHSIGATRRHGLGAAAVRASHHSPDRHYYRYRNFVLLLRDGAARVDASWAGRVTLALAWGPLKVVAFEDDKVSKLRAALAGVRDGLAGRTGPRPTPPTARGTST